MGANDGSGDDDSEVFELACVHRLQHFLIGRAEVEFDGRDQGTVGLAHRPELISELARRFGSQCVVVGIDSRDEDGVYRVYQNTGDPDKTSHAGRETVAWVKEAEQRGAGEFVLNCMNQDGVRQGYDLQQLALVRENCTVPLIASGGAGAPEHFSAVFEQAHVDGALAASVFHKQIIEIGALKKYLQEHHIEVRLS